MNRNSNRKSDPVTELCQVIDLKKGISLNAASRVRIVYATLQTIKGNRNATFLVLTNT